MWLHYHFIGIQNKVYNIASGGGSTFPNINSDLIRKILLPCPTVEEQQKIASILSDISTHLRRQYDYKIKLEQLKKGLMQKLLAGKLRVKV